MSFRREVAPVLVKRCLACHDDKKAAAGLRMTTFALLRKGGEQVGDAILEPGDPSSSFLIETIQPTAAKRMPDKEKALPRAEIVLLERWVSQGAKFDGPSETETPIASLVDPLANLPKIVPKAAAGDPISALASRPDGSILAVGRGRTVLLIDLKDNKVRDTLADHPGEVTSLAWSPDGKALFACGGRPGMFGSIIVWEVATKTKTYDLRGHTDAILSASISPDGKMLATSSYDKSIILWDVVTGKPVRTLLEHTDAVPSVAFAPDGKTLASASADRTVKLWEVTTGKKLATLSEAVGEQSAVVFSTDGGTLFAAGSDRSIRAWEWSAGSAKLVRSTFAHDANILKLVIVQTKIPSSEQVLISSSEDGSVKLWNPRTLEPLGVLETQPDWPLSVAGALGTSRAAIGRYDGSLALYDLSTTKKLAELLVSANPKETAVQPPKLFLPPTLDAPNPRTVARGTKTRVSLSGRDVEDATAVLFPEPGVKTTIVRSEKANPNVLLIDLEVAKDARIGARSFGVQTPKGIPKFQNLLVSEFAESLETEPNDTPTQAKPVGLPALLAGTIDRPGDIDQFLISTHVGKSLVIRSVSQSIGSSWNGVLRLLDSKGKILAESPQSGLTNDPTLTFDPTTDGPVVLEVSDANMGGSPNHFYKLELGEQRYVRSLFPIGVEQGKTTLVALEGSNLGTEKTLPISPPTESKSTGLTSTPQRSPGEPSRSIVTAQGPQTTEIEPNNAIATTTITNPGGVSGRIQIEGDVDLFRFQARKHDVVIVEVFARRLGSPLDPVIEILDSAGALVPLAVLRPVAETQVAFRDHGSRDQGIRLTQWNEFAINDYVLIGREVARILELPRNPDDDCRFWSANGQRLAFLGTTAEQHPYAQPIYKLTVHPPGTTFPSGGISPRTLYHRNDDGGPRFNKDSYLLFNPPNDGVFQIRIEDVQGLGGPDHAYHLVVRKPAPEFRISVNPENPNVPRGGTALVTATIDRIDGFESSLNVKLLDLPEGVVATTATIEQGATSAQLILKADSTAPAFSLPTWKVVATAVDSPNQEVSLDPGGPAGGFISVIPRADIKVWANSPRVRIKPGDRVELELAVERGKAFQGRVPIELRNLPHGVRVLNVGLNGVLITEKQTSRRIFLYAEPWVQPMTRPFYAVATVEAAGIEQSSQPIELVVEKQ